MHLLNLTALGLLVGRSCAAQISSIGSSLDDVSFDTSDWASVLEGVIDDSRLRASAARLVLVTISDEVASYHDAFNHRQNASSGVSHMEASASERAIVQIKSWSLPSDSSKAGERLAFTSSLESPGESQAKCSCGTLDSLAVVVQHVMAFIVIALTATWGWVNGLYRGTRCCGLLAMLAYLRYRGLLTGTE